MKPEYLTPNRIVDKPTLKMDPLGKRLADERVANFKRGQTFDVEYNRWREPVAMPKYSVSK